MLQENHVPVVQQKPQYHPYMSMKPSSSTQSTLEIQKMLSSNSSMQSGPNIEDCYTKMPELIVPSEADWQRFDNEAMKKYGVAMKPKRTLDVTTPVLSSIYYLNKSRSKSIAVFLDAANDFEVMIKLEKTNGDFILFNKSQWDELSAKVDEITNRLQTCSLNNFTTSTSSDLKLRSGISINIQEVYNKMCVIIKGSVVSKSDYQSTIYMQKVTWDRFSQLNICLNIGVNQREMWRSEVLNAFYYYCSQLSEMFKSSNYYYTGCNQKNITEFVDFNINSVGPYYSPNEITTCNYVNCELMESEFRVLCRDQIVKNILNLII